MDKEKQVHCFGLKNGGVVAGSEKAEQEARLFHAQKGKLKCCRGRWLLFLPNLGKCSPGRCLIMAVWTQL